MQIYVQMPNGQTISIEASSDKATVYDVKKILMEKKGIQIEDQILFYNNDVLRNDKILTSCGIYEEAYLQSETIESLLRYYKEQMADQKGEIERWSQKFSYEQEQKDQLSQVVVALQNDLQQQQKKTIQAEIELKLFKEQQQWKSKRFQQSYSSQNELKDEMKKLELENSFLRQSLQNLGNEKQTLENEIKLVKQEKEQLSPFVQDYYNCKEELRNAKNEIRTYQGQLEQQNTREIQTQDEVQFLKVEIRQLQQQIEEIRTKNQQLELEKVKLELCIQNQNNLNKKIHDLEESTEIYEKRIKGQKSQINSLQDQVNQLQYKNDDEMRSPSKEQVDKIQSQETKIAKLTAEKKSIEIEFNHNQQLLSEKKKQVTESQKKLEEKEHSLERLKQQQIENNLILKNKDHEINLLKYELNEMKNEVEVYKQGFGQLKFKFQADSRMVKEIDSDVFNVEEKLRAIREENKREQKLQEQQRQIEQQEKLRKQKEVDIRQQELMKSNKENRQKTAQFLQKQMMETHGIIEVCFLIDVTGSMNQYKDQAMKCIRESMKNIKIKTNRDTLWATVAYQDFEELKQLGGLYKQHNFTPKPQDIEDFLAAQTCTGGGDTAEDMKGGINQMIRNLSWSKTFKIAVLICDAPNHGKRYNGGVSDKYPDEDLGDAIQLMIKNNILFVAILFNTTTQIMFEEIQKIYKHMIEKNYQYLQIQKKQMKVEYVSQASQRATQTNNKGTKSKNELTNKKSQLGAMEALCKQIKDPFQFDRLPGVRCVQSKFGVIRVEIKQDSFETNIDNIKRIDTNRDFSVFQEGQWQCNRTEKFFAQGQMKQVFLMKRESMPNELYVIKMPLGDRTYNSQQAAIHECRSHLISKCLMKKFIRELQEARNKNDRTFKIPEVQYSNFLILQDLANGNSYWIAERYFAGEFVKYNNNNGFISDENSDINHFAQAFTYYTFYISNFNYMVSDVQGVGNYFTDPALITKEGSFDETDMGKDGQSMFIVSYTGKKHLGKTYLDLLGIKT